MAQRCFDEDIDDLPGPREFEMTMCRDHARDVVLGNRFDYW